MDRASVPGKRCPWRAEALRVNRAQLDPAIRPLFHTLIVSAEMRHLVGRSPGIASWFGLALSVCLALWVLAASGSCAAQGTEAAGLRFSSDFEGGSGELLEIDQEKQHVRFRPSSDPRFGWPCWWYFRLDEIEPGTPVTIEVDGADVRKAEGGNQQADGRPLNPAWMMPGQAFYSTDGETWQQTVPGKRGKEGRETRMSWTATVDAATAWFAWGPRFVPSDAERLVDRIDAASPDAEAFELCRTREGRPVPALKIGAEGGDEKRYGVWIQARQHAWESGSSWVGRGLTEWLVSDDPQAAELRQRADFVIVPIMDIDNTARGAGGKGQLPQDHNRDWSDTPHWRSTAAAMQAIRDMDEAERFDLFVDLHNPAPNDKRPYFFYPPDDDLSERGRRNGAEFFAACRDQIVDPLPLLPQRRISGQAYDPILWQSISKNWVAGNTADHVVAVTLETAWNTPESNQQGYLTVGRQLGKAIAAFLQSNPRGAID